MRIAICDDEAVQQLLQKYLEEWVQLNGEVLDKLKKRGKSEEKHFFQTDKGPVSLPLSKIWYVEARAHQCILYTEGAEYILYSGISEMAQLLGGHREFVRCHRSYLVNVQHISAVVKSELILDDKRRLPVSRNSEKAVNQGQAWENA